MDNSLNVHAGHRERMIEKLIKSPEVFSEHELIETLLFFLLPRKDTNELAHVILNSFGSLEGVFNATPEQLKKIKGVGEKVAAGIAAIGQIIKRISSKKLEPRELRSFESIKEVLVNYFKDKWDEIFLVLLLDKDFYLIAMQSFSDKKHNAVSATVPELISAFEMHKPAYAILAHNHFSGLIEPSEEDIFTTQKINVLCELHSVKLSDHVIVYKDRIFSMAREGLLQNILKSSNLKQLFKNINKI